LTALAPALALEAFCAAQVLSDLPEWGLLAVGVEHVGACLIFGWACVPRGTPNRAGQILAGVIAFLGFPVFGMIAMLSGLVAISTQGANRSGATQEDALDREESSIQGTDRLADLHAALGVQPIADLLLDGDASLKRGAIDTLVKTRGCQAATALQPLLRDADAEIRMYASIRLCDLEDEISREVQAAGAATADPNAPAASWEKLARAYLDYVSSGLLDAASARQCLKLAEDAYQAGSRVAPGQHQLALEIGRTYLRSGPLDRARMYLEHAAEGALPAGDAELALMELDYRRGALAELPTRAARLVPNLCETSPQRGIVEWWAAA
jgi:hypothetical protein